MFDLHYFNKFKSQSDFFLAGCDEVGRGPLAGPVVAACVSIHLIKYNEKEIKNLLQNLEGFGVNDSKKLKEKKREEILNHFSYIPQNLDLLSVDQIYTHHYSKNIQIKISIKEIQSQTIDQINILNASLQAMREAANEVCDIKKNGTVLIDGNKKFKSDSTSVELITVVKGDTKSLLIGFASIVAKVYRDRLMKKYDVEYPGYFWKQNAGYGTAKHLKAISVLGVTKIHRKTFKGVKEHYEEGR